MGIINSLTLRSTFCEVTSTNTFTPWTYQCGPENFCIKLASPGDSQGISLTECKLTCGEHLQLWPRPNGDFEFDKTVTTFNPENIEVIFSENTRLIAQEWFNDTLKERLDWLKNEVPHSSKSIKRAEAPLRITVGWTDEEDTPILRINTEESYALEINGHDITIDAVTYFGARHALETLSQLMGYDDVNACFIINSKVNIVDRPEFRHRGILLDSARNFMSLDVIENVINGMSFNKLNVFHWHLSDTQSFPLQLENHPDSTGKMAQYGAYGSDKIYTKDQVKELITYATKRGVRIIPEFDAPAHVGYGWQYPGAEDYTVCLGKQPWEDFCLQPPCGQLNPYVDEMYSVLEQIYEEYFDIFQFDTFHYGGDEVDFRCWNSSEAVTNPMRDEGLSLDEQGFVTIWTRFQTRARSIAEKVNPDVQEHLIWTNSLTHAEHIETSLPTDYTVQIWTNSFDEQVKTLVKSGHKMLFSNVDALYMDCGFSAHVGSGVNWCSPYKSWQTVYDNDLYKILERNGGTSSDYARITGAEVALWTETVSGNSFEMKMFPRASAHAERLWTNPKTSYVDAQKRLVDFTHRLQQRGVGSDAVQPEYCRLNEGKCFLPSHRDPDDDLETTTPEATTSKSGARKLCFQELFIFSL